MKLLVVKFGGACFSTAKRTQLIARHIVQRGRRVVVVVSARQGVTDTLVRAVAAPDSRDGSAIRDAMLCTGKLQSAARLASMLVAAGRPSSVVPPWTVVHTDSEFGDASIVSVNPTPILQVLRDGSIPVVPGFVGADAHGRITTLGRGGSDYSAVAIAHALHADVELCKAEVDGVYTDDPHTHPDARKFASLTHVEALELARAGARVLQAKAAALALDGHVHVRIRPAFGLGGGTVIDHAPELHP
jgi:aspartate kinase